MLDVSIPSETEALNVRSQEAKARGTARGTQLQVDQFEQAIQNAEAVVCQPLAEVSRLAFSENEVYATFYQRMDAGMRIPDGDKWDRLRAAADTHLFGENKKYIRFAALSVDGIGMDRYGECSVALKTPMIEHRASLIEENSVAFMKRHQVSAATDYAFPPGYRAPWSAKSKLAVAKLADRIQPESAAKDFSHLLLSKGPDGWQDNFVEVHIWGTLTIRSVRQVRIERWRNRPRKSELLALREKLEKVNVVLVAV